MLNRFEDLNGRLASIEENLRPIAAVAMHLMESGLLAQLAAIYGCPPPNLHAQPASVAEPDNAEPEGPTPFVVTDAAIESGYWMSRKEAWNRLGVVKSTLEGMIRSGELAAYHKTCDQHKEKPRVWLKSADVDRMYTTYTLRKGKEKQVGR